MLFKKTVLQNGMRVVSEFHPESRAVAIGIWIMSGSRDDRTSESGMAHLLEHLVFKGTKTRSAFQIAKSLEALGGELNAYTSKENTVYHCLVLKDHWKKGLEVLCDLVANMKLKKADFELEKSVVVQEIAMDEDHVEDIIFDAYFAQALPASTLGRPILGTAQSITAMKMAQVLNYYRRTYSGSNMIVSGAGDFRHQDFVEEVQRLLGKKSKVREKHKVLRLRPHVHRAQKGQKIKHVPIRAVIEKPSEQMHLLLGFPCTSYRDPMRFEAFIVNALLGGGMTSKLFQKIREKRGLVYTIYSTLNTFEDFGLIQIYAACEKNNVKKVLDLIKGEIHRLMQKRISAHDLNLFKTQVKGALLLGADDIENRMNSIAVNEMVFAQYKSTEKIIEEIDRVTIQSVNEFVHHYVKPKKIAAVLMGKGATELEPWFQSYQMEESSCWQRK